MCGTRFHSYFITLRMFRYTLSTIKYHQRQFMLMHLVFNRMFCKSLFSWFAHSLVVRWNRPRQLLHRCHFICCDDFVVSIRRCTGRSYACLLEILRLTGREGHIRVIWQCLRSDSQRSREACSLHTLQFRSSVTQINLWTATAKRVHVLRARQP